MRIKNLFKKTEEKIRDFQIGKYKITLKESHILDEFQLKFPLYDRFLPLLCEKLDGLIIDIGANIGDTAIAILDRNDNSFVVSVEPDKYFFNECVENININNLEVRFYGINNFISSSIGKYEVNKNEVGATGSISEISLSENAVNAISFKELMEKIPNLNKSFDLLKIDTDGYDWDILNTFYDYSLEANELPRFVFFEMQTFLNNEELNQKGRDEFIENYQKSVSNLKKMGYDSFCLLDNFGTHFKTTKDLQDILDANNYIKKSQIFNKNTTIYYFDVLAFKNTDLSYVNDVLLNLTNKV